MNKLEIISYLENLNIEYELYNHEAIFTVEEAKKIDLPYPQYEAKNLFLRDDKKRNYYLIVTKFDTSINLKNLKEMINSRNLPFASSEDLKKYLDLLPGSVSPFGILNNEERNVKVYIEDYFKDLKIGIHPNTNEATLYLNTNDLFKIIEDHNNPVSYLKIN